MAEYLFQLNFGIDQLLFKDSQDPLNAGRMSPTTAFCFLNIAIALAFYVGPTSLYLRKPTVTALATTLIISGLVFISFIPNLLVTYWQCNHLKNTLY